MPKPEAPPKASDEVRVPTPPVGTVVQFFRAGIDASGDYSGPEACVVLGHEASPGEVVLRALNSPSGPKPGGVVWEGDTSAQHGPDSHKRKANGYWRFLPGWDYSHPAYYEKWEAALEKRRMRAALREAALAASASAN